ncbi:alpha/beta fold hydrolase [Aeromicrobium sp. UC242_57]|uniref:alpha/beta fold hydrolase n=1 Tax=Aeromicrobium sp. UC242_57 TaxID=3374624 RepID=UPI0037A4ECAA
MGYSCEVLTSLADGRIWADRYGDGEPSIIALHGWGRSRHDWSPVLPHRNALAVDLPGFGASPAPDTAWTTAEYADALAPVLAAYTSPVLVGHSFGGRVAVQVAARHPGLLGGVLLTGVPLLRNEAPSGKPAFRYRSARWLNRRGILSDDRMDSCASTTDRPTTRLRPACCAASWSTPSTRTTATSWSAWTSSVCRPRWCGASTTPRRPSRWHAAPAT